MQQLTMPKKTRKYSQGENPKSLENLSPREPIYGVNKKRHEITVTEEGWNGSREMVKRLGCTGISDFIEKFGRGLIVCATTERREITVSHEGWSGLQETAKQLGCNDIEDLLEKLGKGLIAVGQSSSEIDEEADTEDE